MRNVICEILNTIPSEHVFDSHFVIQQLIKNHSDEYLNFARKLETEIISTANFHSQIAQIIATFQDTIISRLEGVSWSDNIHGKPSACAIWRKLP